MNLVHERKKKPGTWEVAWTWLPQFLGADAALVKSLDRALTIFLANQEVMSMEYDKRCNFLSQRALELIIEKYPIKGLGSYLAALSTVNPEVKSYELQ